MKQGKKLKPNSPEEKLLDALFGKPMKGDCKGCGKYTEEGVETPINSGKITCPSCMNKLIGGNDEEETLDLEVNRAEAGLLFKILVNTKIEMDNEEQGMLKALTEKVQML